MQAGLVLGTISGMASGNAFAAGSNTLGLVVPSYFSPTDATNWNGVITTARKAATTTILNPDSGPGTREDPISRRPSPGFMRQARK